MTCNKRRTYLTEEVAEERANQLVSTTFAQSLVQRVEFCEHHDGWHVKSWKALPEGFNFRKKKRKKKQENAKETKAS